MKITSKKIEIILTWLPYLLLLYVSFINLSWNITDHDDGHTLGFHNMGRNSNIQRSYGAYDSMCDYLLKFLSVDYRLLIGFMVGATILASIAILYFSAEVLKKWFILTPIEITFAQVLFLLAMPEYLYMALSFKSVYIAMAIILASAIIQFKNSESYCNIILAALLFGIGVSFRWNMLMMGVPFATMFLWDLKQKNNWLKSIGITFLWGIVALCFSLFFIYVSGYSPETIIDTYIWGKDYVGKTDFQLIARIGDLSLFFTPATALLLILSVMYFIKFRAELGKFGLLFMSTFLAVSVISILPSFKFYAPFWICFIGLFAFAYKLIVSYSSIQRKIAIGLVISTIAFNWFIGIQISTLSSNWGPGLDVKTNIASLKIFDKNLNTDERFKLENIKIGFFDGFCLPTSEGMRPLYGHFYALFAGKLNQLDEKLNRETDTIIIMASRNNQFIYQDRINPYLLASYCRLEYRTSDFWLQKGKDFSKRKFTDGLNSFTEVRINDPKKLFDIPLFRKQFTRNDTVFLSFTYTSSLNKFLYNLYLTDDISFKKIGPMSAKVWF